jgi:hypothetical protein
LIAPITFFIFKSRLIGKCNGNKVNRGVKITEYLGGHPEHPEKMQGVLEITPTQLTFIVIELRSAESYYHSPTRIEKKVFSIPIQKIIDVRVDTAKNVNLRKAIAVGLWAFGWKDKILAIDFKDDTGMHNTAFFKGRKLEEIRNYIIANRYALHKKKTPMAQKKAKALPRMQKEAVTNCVYCGAKIESGYLCRKCKKKLEQV